MSEYRGTDRMALNAPPSRNLITPPSTRTAPYAYLRTRSPDAGGLCGCPRVHRCGLCAIHQRRRAPPPASSLMEQHLVSALLVRRHQLHAPLDLRDLCGARLVHRRLCHYHLSPSRPDLSNSAARLLAGVTEQSSQMLM